MRRVGDEIHEFKWRRALPPPFAERLAAIRKGEHVAARVELGGNRTRPRFETAAEETANTKCALGARTLDDW